MDNLADTFCRRLSVYEYEQIMTCNYESEERFICVSLGADYYEPGDWDCKEIRDKYDAYNTQMLISYIAFLPIDSL